MALPVALLLFLVVRAAARGRHRTALILVVPYIGLAVFRGMAGGRAIGLGSFIGVVSAAVFWWLGAC